MIENKVGVQANVLQLFYDDQYKKKIVGKDQNTVDQLKLKNGDIVFVANKDTTFVDPNQPKIQEATQSKVMMKADGSEMIDTSSNKMPQSPDLKKHKSIVKPLSQEEVKKGHCNHGANGKCINCLGVTKDNVSFIKHKCTHEVNQKCANCINAGEDGKINNAKHQSFEHFLAEMKAKCKNMHRIDQMCQNCAPVQTFSYKVNYNCPNHKPFPEGMCNKCLPPTVVLKRQSYRHVDYVSFMNFLEMHNFVSYWQSKSCMEQRVGHLYGYYSEDPNYPDGVRVNIEAVYEPPQFGEINGYEEMDDPTEKKIERVAAALQLERVGIIFTTLNSDVFLTSQDIKKISALQEKYVVNHPAGYKVSKFVTVVVQPKGDGNETGVECYMVSDQCQALQRDNIFGNSDSRKMMVVREAANENEMIPAVVKEGKTVKEFEPDFFIVSLANGQPQAKKDFHILKNYDFPAANRDKTRGSQDYRNYIKRHKSEPSQRKFANFHLLVYIAEMMDIDTAETIAKHVAEETPIDPATVELLESI